MLTARGQQHSFSTHERVFLGKCLSFWDRKCLDLRGTRTPNLRIHAECSNLLSYQGQTFAVPCCWILALTITVLLMAWCMFGVKQLIISQHYTSVDGCFVEPLPESSHDDVIKWKLFRVTGHLCGIFTGLRWIPHTKASDAELWYFPWSAPE